jgi:hypothetical protein
MRHTAQSVHELLRNAYPLTRCEHIPTPQEIEDIGKREALRLLVAEYFSKDAPCNPHEFAACLGVRLEEEDHV